MKDLNLYVKSYKEQLSKGDIQKAYAGLTKYVMGLKTTLSKNLSKRYAFGNLFQGYMDYTYFYYSNDLLKKHKLKMGLVLNHEKMRFEVWLLGQTIAVQEKYWQYFKSTRWNEGRTNKPHYAILETVLVENPDFDDLNTLSKQMEERLALVTEEIIKDVKASRLA